MALGQPPSLVFQRESGEHHFALEEGDADFARNGLCRRVRNQNVSGVDASRAQLMSMNTHRVEARSSNIEQCSQIDDWLLHSPVPGSESPWCRPLDMFPHQEHKRNVADFGIGPYSYPQQRLVDR